MIVLLTFAAFAQDCPEVSTARQLTRELEAASVAFAAMDEETFAAAEARASALLPCVLEPIPAEGVAAYHRMRGLRAFTLGDRDGTTSWFRAALDAEPDYSFPVQIAPEGGPVDRLWVGAQRIPTGDVQAFEIEPGRVLLVNGERRVTRPLEFPVVLQVEDGDAIALTALLPAHETFVLPIMEPSRAAKAAGRRDLDELDEREPKEKKGGRGGVVAAAVVTGVVAGGLWGGSAMSRSAYEQDPTRAGRQLTNGLWIGSVGAGAAAVGIGAFAAYSGSF